MAKGSEKEDPTIAELLKPLGYATMRALPAASLGIRAEASRKRALTQPNPSSAFLAR
jgi:hypothetical protein